MTYVGEAKSKFVLLWSFIFHQSIGIFSNRKTYSFTSVTWTHRTPILWTNDKFLTGVACIKKLQNYLTGQLLSQLMKITLHVRYSLPLINVLWWYSNLTVLELRFYYLRTSDECLNLISPIHSIINLSIRIAGVDISK